MSAFPSARRAAPTAASSARPSNAFPGLLEPYLDALVREIAHTGDLLRASGRTVRTLYIGGGTPTTLSAAQLRRLMEALRTHIDLTELVEYTVEGGRPDTLDAEKLETIASMGCGRMSINPQTMNDAVLARVGRRHTAAQTVAAYEAARAAGYDAVNMDLIAGLPAMTQSRLPIRCGRCWRWTRRM